MNNTNETFLGRLGKEPELAYTPKQKAVCTLSVAVNHKVGEDENTEWVKVKVWERQAELCKVQLKKGSQIFVNGKREKKEFTNKDGKHVVYNEVNAQLVGFSNV